MEEKFYTITEIANSLNISPRTVSSLIKKGKLFAVNIGTGKRQHWRVYDGQFQKFLAESYMEIVNEN